MSFAPLRPRFQTRLPCHPRRAFSQFRQRLQQPDCAFEGTVLEGFISITPKSEFRHYWSPVLTVQAEPFAEGTCLRGHYGPHPNAWTLLVAVAAAILFSGIFALTYGCAQLLLGQTPWALWAAPLTAVLLGLLYGLALFGQWRAQAQMQQLKAFFDVSVCVQRSLEQSPIDSCAACQQLAQQC